MSGNIRKKVLLIGAGQMAVDHFNVLMALNCHITVIGRSEGSAKTFGEKTGYKIEHLSLSGFLDTYKEEFDGAVIAVGMEQLAGTTAALLKHGIKNILVEKPAGMDTSEIRELAELAQSSKANVLVAYNRRFYSSVLKAKEIIDADGGVSSFNFEFTEWSHTIEPLKKYPGIKENWLLANSSHVIDLAFYLGGKPSEISCFASGKLSWHEHSVFSGAGVAENGALFSYCANWDAPGRWGVEILTKNSRLILRPLEGLLLQQKGSVAILPVELENANDQNYKPGLFLQSKNFLEGNISSFKTIGEQAEMAELYSRIAEGR
jgi:predicted dehydrogenase